MSFIEYDNAKPNNDPFWLINHLCLKCSAYFVSSGSESASRRSIPSVRNRILVLGEARYSNRTEYPTWKKNWAWFTSWRTVVLTYFSAKVDSHFISNSMGKTDCRNSSRLNWHQIDDDLIKGNYYTLVFQYLTNSDRLTLVQIILVNKLKWKRIG